MLLLTKKKIKQKENDGSIITANMYHKVKLYTECKHPRMENYIYQGLYPMFSQKHTTFINEPSKTLSSR